MCGRFALRSPLDKINEKFHLSKAVVLKPRYNIAPSQVVPIIRTPGVLEFLTWGLRPDWLPADKNPFINARAETITTKPAFKKAYAKQRGLVLTDGYYEWKQINGKKQPYFISLPDNQVFALAAIWQNDTCALVTTRATDTLLGIHERMPVIVPPDSYDIWLQERSAEQKLSAVISRNNQINLQIHPVSMLVNNPKHDDPSCVAALA